MDGGGRGIERPRVYWICEADSDAYAVDLDAFLTCTNPSSRDLRSHIAVLQMSGIFAVTNYVCRSELLFHITKHTTYRSVNASGVIAIDAVTMCSAYARQ